MFGGAGATGALSDTWTLGSRLNAEVNLFGRPCGFVLPALTAHPSGARPWIGSAFEMRVSTVPTSRAVVAFLGASATSWQGFPLPLNLGVLGLPNCQVHVSLDIPVDPRRALTHATVTLPIPPSVALNGAVCFVQSVEFFEISFPSSWLLSKAAQLRMGLR